MWIVHFMLTLAALYAVSIAGMFFAQNRLLFPTMFAGAARVQLPASTWRLEVRTPDGKRLAGVRIPSQRATADGAPTLLGFGGNAWNAEVMALTLHALFPHRDVVAFHYRGYAPSSGRPSARALFSDSLIILDHLERTQGGERIIPVGFSIGAAVAAYLARHRPVVGLFLITPFDSLEAVARDLYWWVPVGLLIRNRMPTIEFVRGSLAPTALIIAERDTIVPKRRSAPLRAAIRNLVFEGAIDAGHNDLYDHPDFASAAREALMRVEAASGETPGRPRWLPQKSFPPYAYLPGKKPHPVRDPMGHSYHVEPIPVGAAASLDSETFLWGLDLFNHGYYWEAHEAWEGLWQGADRDGPLRMLFKGLILLSAAGIKIREGKHAVAVRHSGRAAALLRRLMKVPDRAFERALGMSPAALAEYAEAASRIPAALQATAPGHPQPVFNFILGSNSRGRPSGSQKRNSPR